MLGGISDSSDETTTPSDFTATAESIVTLSLNAAIGWWGAAAYTSYLPKRSIVNDVGAVQTEDKKS